MLKAIRLFSASGILNVCFSNENLPGIGMPELPEFTDYIRA
ncbi:hypothetical protein [Escherichia coli]|nr:hypothetical protein [Escherichia coli]